EGVAGPGVIAAARRVRDETLAYPTHPQACPGGVRVTWTSGETLESGFPRQRGGPENPLSADEVRAKFRDNAGLALAGHAVAALEEAILGLEMHEDLGAALAPLALTEVARV